MLFFSATMLATLLSKSMSSYFSLQIPRYLVPVSLTSRRKVPVRLLQASSRRYELWYVGLTFCVFFLMTIAIKEVATIKDAIANTGVVSGIVGDGEAVEVELDEGDVVDKAPKA